jgi:hypothetical protein
MAEESKKPAPAGQDPLAYQDKGNEKAQDKIIDRVADAKEEGRRESDELFAERMAHGFAPPYDPTDPRPREEKERDVQEALGISPEMGDIHGPKDKDSASIKDASYEPKSSAEVAAELERLRSGPSIMQGEVRDVTINGTRYRVPTGAGTVDMPSNVQEVLQQADRPVRTTQMLGGGDGVPTIDLTKPKKD